MHICGVSFFETEHALIKNSLVALISHLAELHLTDDLTNHANEVYMRAILVQGYLENISSALSLIRDMTKDKVSALNEEEEVSQEFNKRLDDSIIGSRSGKIVVGKVARSLAELRSRSLSLTPDALPLFERCQTQAQQLKEYSQCLGGLVGKSVHEEEHTAGMTYRDVWNMGLEAASNCYGVKETLPFETFVDTLRVLNGNLGELNGFVTDPSQMMEFERAPAPWILRAQQMRAAARRPQDVEEQIQALKEAAHESVTQLRLREKALEESTVKIELLEARTTDTAEKTEKLAALQRALAEGRNREQKLDAAMEATKRELQETVTEREKWKVLAESEQKSGRSKGYGSEDRRPNASTTPAPAVEGLVKEIKDLQGAVRYLRDDNRRLRTSESSEVMTWLRTPLSSPPSDEQSRASLLRSEGQDVLHEMLHLATRAQVFDLRQTPTTTTIVTNRLAWRPANTTPQWHVTRQREEWERWNEWKDAVVEKGRLPARSRREGERDDSFNLGKTRKGRRRRRYGREEGERGEEGRRATRVEMVMDQTDRRRKLQSSPTPASSSFMAAPVSVSVSVSVPGPAPAPRHPTPPPSSSNVHIFGDDPDGTPTIIEDSSVIDIVDDGGGEEMKGKKIGFLEKGIRTAMGMGMGMATRKIPSDTY